VAVRILQGGRITEATALPFEPSERRLVIDVGGGDGRWAYEQARARPDAVFVALDPDAGALSEYSLKAARKPARGGVPNAAFVVASVEDPPAELDSAADEVRVNYPWSALLRGLLRPESAVLAGLAYLGKPDAAFTLILTYDASHDHGAGLDAGTPSLDQTNLETLKAPYAAAGLHVGSIRRLSREEALAIPSTWGRRLLHGRPRAVFEVTGRVRK
jgi:16S rRNA (adenine(1408)-N(1))-methyltransferase